MTISLRPSLPTAFSPTRAASWSARAAYPTARASSPQAPSVRPCSRWGLPSHPSHLGCWWSLTPPFHPDQPCGWRSVLCGTVPRVAPGGCCPPPCSVESGLSSAPVREPRSPGQLVQRQVYGLVAGLFPVRRRGARSGSGRLGDFVEPVCTGNRPDVAAQGDEHPCQREYRNVGQDGPGPAEVLQQEASGARGQRHHGHRHEA